MTKGHCPIRRGRPLLRTGLSTFAVFLAVLMSARPVCAVRANWGVRMEGPRLEKAGRYEDAAVYYRGGLDFYAVIYQLWIEAAVYDGRADEIYRKGAAIFGDANWRGAREEERWDTIGAYIVFHNREGAARCVQNGKFTESQRARLEDRVRVYMEDLLDPESGFGGDFSFARKARILESVGLFRHAAFRRELAGRYAILVCSRYYAAVADEMERAFGDRARARLYRRKAAFWRTRGLEELHRSNGDRFLSRLKGNRQDDRLDREGVVRLLTRGLHDANVDARLAAVHVLAELGELTALEEAMKDRDVSVRRAASAVFARKMHVPGLALALRDGDAKVSSEAEGVLHVKRESAGPYQRALHFLADGAKEARTRTFAVEHLRRLGGGGAAQPVRPGVLVEYFTGKARGKPVVTKVLETVDIGMKFRANFPKTWYEYWDKPAVFPPDARGPFRLRFTAKLYVPEDGLYRFYVKTDAANRARLFIETPANRRREIISPKNDGKLQYVAQVGMQTHRIDFSEPVSLKKGLTGVHIEYTGDEVRNLRNKHMVRISGEQKAGIQLFWSSDAHLTELIPAANLFH